ncbi:1-propanol dehydrogenase PduQ [Intestinibacter bartlettii]|uniref:Iron-containing alcohol dehydrogenase n=1 Tax=Intestinibacter bartlettii TaxID=261299 RepID=A0ABS6DTB3_9FIRM|nr:1-propanol dehydrogenase PduQ [Intestinibacter bartlettii]MBU5335080.1 iron-containing alcohol dehydrogenase [Intestinibacter bartlettii]MDO5009395.1 1-propanol dehydrogenase PduQ [Intestinibacter bartlettii]
MKTFQINTKINFGQGALASLEKLEGKRVLLITDPFMVKSGLVNEPIKYLQKSEYTVFSDIVPDPPIEVVTSGIKVFKEFMPDAVVALGGGSAIDSSKAIVYFSKKILNLGHVQLIAIPTTSGTGSEATSFSVITDKQKGAKYPIASDELLPDVAILDPELVKSVPPNVTADTGMDVLTHAIEAYVSTQSHDCSDALAERAIKLVCEYLPKAYADGNDIKAREKMHNASCLAGIAFDKVSLGINHSIAHAIGAKFHISHGRANSLLLVHVIDYNSQIDGYKTTEFSEAAKKYAEISSFLKLNIFNEKVAVDSLKDAIIKLQKQLNMPLTLTECGIDPKEVEAMKDEIAELALNDNCTKTNPVKPTKEDIIKILEKII